MSLEIVEYSRGGEPPVRSASDPRLRRSFLAHTRHELRTPLNAILGYSELILEELEDGDSIQRDRVGPDVERIRRAGKELLDLVNTLFDPSSFELEHGFEWREYRARVTQELRTPLTAAIGYCEMLLEELGETSEWLTSELHRIRAAGLRLLSLLDGLLQELEAEAPDALRESPNAGPVSAEALVSAAVVVGMEAAGASITLQSADLLVVDDNEMNRDLLLRRLARQGHRVTPAESGHQALEMAREQRFDIILLDVLMPGINGLETLRLFKEDPLLRDTPIIMISALDEMDSVVRCIELGAEDYLPKTFDPVLLQARIGACLEKKAFRDREKEYIRQIEDGKRRADELLRVILPEPIVQELQATNTVKPRLYEDVAVLFCDVVNFTPYCAERRAEEVISNLQQLIERYEGLCLEHGVQKIKTVGDSFMATAGLLFPCEEPAVQCVRCALDMVHEARKLPNGWRVRVGVHFGPVVAGVVGLRQYIFDLWGDTVNTAARVESRGANDAVNVSADVWRRVSHCFSGVSLGLVELKGKGEVEMFQILGARLDHSSSGLAAG